MNETTVALPASILAGHRIQLRCFQGKERRAVGGISRHTEDAAAPRAHQGCPLSLPSPPKAEGVEMAQQKPSESGGHGDGAACKEPESYRDPAAAGGRQPRVEQERQGSTQLPLSAATVSYCLPDAKASGRPADRADSSADSRSEPPGRRAEKGVGGTGGWGRERPRSDHRYLIKKVPGKDPDAWKDLGQEEKGITENEMAGWHH